MNWGDLINQKRIQRRWDREKLSQKTSIPVETIAQYEREYKYPSVNDFLKLSLTLMITEPEARKALQNQFINHYYTGKVIMVQGGSIV